MAKAEERAILASDLMSATTTAREIVDSLRSSDEGIRRWPALFGLVGFCLLVLASMKCPKLPAVKEFMIIIANPVAHGVIQAELIINTLSETQYSVVSDSAHSRLTTDAQVHFPTTSPRSLLSFGIGSSLFEALRIRMTLGYIIRNNQTRIRIYDEYLLLAQCVRYVLADRLLSLHPRIKLVITDFDRAVYSRPLIDIARNRGIPTVTTFHGSPSKTSYLPIRAETAFAWGDAQEEWLRTEAPDTRVCVVGRPSASKNSCTTAGAPRLIILNSLEVLSTHEAEKLVELITVHRAKNHQTLVRLHPKCRTSDIHQPTWHRVLDAVDNVVHSDNDLSHFLSQNDVVCGVGSTGMIDALLLDIQVVGVADSQRVLPVDLRYIMNHEHVAARQIRNSVVRATGDEFIANARTALALILAE